MSEAWHAPGARRGLRAAAVTRVPAPSAINMCCRETLILPEVSMAASTPRATLPRFDQSFYTLTVNEINCVYIQAPGGKRRQSHGLVRCGAQGSTGNVDTGRAAIFRSTETPWRSFRPLRPPRPCDVQAPSGGRRWGGKPRRASGQSGVFRDTRPEQRAQKVHGRPRWS